MISPSGIEFRKAEEKDVFPLMRLYQLSSHPRVVDRVLLDYRLLEERIRSRHSIWIVAEQNNQLLAVFSLLIDPDNRLAKINRLYIDPHWKNWKQLLAEGLPLLINFLKDEKRSIEGIYMTTRTFTLAQQEMALDLGFKILGIFPVSPVGEVSKLNGLTAFFIDGILDEKRYNDFALHPMVAPFYEITRRECGLAPLPIAEVQTYDIPEFDPLPKLELIYAPRFVQARFALLNEKKSLATHFYPFSIPNTLITDPEGKVEIYVKMIPEARMATVIGERLDLSVDPTELYQRMSQMLNPRNINYIEVISDAADVWGIDCIIKAGFLPCAYFPCLKRQGDGRRDYVVLARSYERWFVSEDAPTGINPTYLEYFSEYYKLEGREYLSRFQEIPQNR